MALLLLSSLRPSHVLLGFLLLVIFPTDTAEPLYPLCSDNGTDYIAHSAFESNLKSLLSSLPGNGSATGFFNGTAGDIPDRVYGLVLCRGDVPASGCWRCLATATQDVVQTCPYKRSAVIWYDECMLRYSNQWFFSVPADDSLMVSERIAENVTNVTQFNRQRDQLMAGLVRYAAYNRSARMFATGEADYDDPATPKVYGLVQCTRDQTADDCNRCLKGVVAKISRQASGSKGALILKATCNFRYDLYPFYEGPAMVSIPLPTNETSPTTALQPPTVELNPPMETTPTEAKKKKKNPTGIGLAIAIPLVAVFVVISIMCICFRRRMHFKEKKPCMSDTTVFSTIKSLLFNLSTLRAATGNFSDLNKLGQGGFGSVYKGLLPDGQEIAVKRLSAGSRQGEEELKNEVALLAKVQHRNLVRLLGVCLEGKEKLLVYEYVPNRSLDTFLFDPERTRKLNWEQRYNIILGIARGLRYLHEDSPVRIIHRDLKASNVLLDADMNSKISDFGLARLFGGDQSQASTTRVVGTYGYMAPEYAIRGKFSNKSDVYSFGVLVLEALTGQRNSAFSDSGTSTDLLSCVWKHWTNGTVPDIIDPSLGGQCQGSQVMRCAQIGLLCVQEAPTERPTMSSVVLMLSKQSVSLRVPPRPAFVFGFTQPSADVLNRNFDSSTSTTRDESASKSVP